MIAFYKHGNYLVKVYKQGLDLQTMFDNSEQWFSWWQDNGIGSINNSIEKTCNKNNIPFIPSFVVICK